MRPTLFLCALLALAGCGSKGPLVLRPTQPAANAPAPAPAPADHNSKPAEAGQ